MKVRCPLERPRPSSWGGWPHASPRHRSGIAMDDVDRLPSMTVTARRYTSEPGFTDDFFAVREFLVRINADRVTTPAFLWGRWEWAFCLPYLDRDALNRIGVWESDGEADHPVPVGRGVLQRPGQVEHRVAVPPIGCAKPARVDDPLQVAIPVGHHQPHLAVVPQ